MEKSWRWGGAQFDALIASFPLPGPARLRSASCRPPFRRGFLRLAFAALHRLNDRFDGGLGGSGRRSGCSLDHRFLYASGT
jgi:hypothetical protein